MRSTGKQSKKLNLLLNYRQSYQLQLQNASQHGMGHAEWRNFMTFVNKLDAAITDQRRAVQYAESNRKTGCDEYQACRRKLNAYDTVSQRHQKIRVLKQKKLNRMNWMNFHPIVSPDKIPI